MAKKKKRKKETKKEEERILKGRCLKCGKPMGRNFKSCHACRRKERLRRKANKRGRKKNYYLNSNEK